MREDQQLKSRIVQKLHLWKKQVEYSRRKARRHRKQGDKVAEQVELDRCQNLMVCIYEIESCFINQ